MSWLGSTIKSLDTRKELVNYIGGNTQPSRAVVTNSGGEIDSSVVTVAELALLSGVSSNVQTQLTGLGDDKQDEITGAATSVTSANLTSDRVLLSDGAGKIIVSDVTATTLAYLDPTSSIQGQINSKQSEITASAPLSQSKVQGLADSLSGKQPTIGSSTNLVVNKISFGSGGSTIDFQGVVPTNSTLVLSSGGTLTLTDSANGTVAADLSGINTDTDTNTTNASLSLSSGTLTLTDSASGSVAADISGIDTQYSVFNSATAGLVPASQGTGASLFLNQAGSFINIPQADDVTLGGVKIDGNNLSINPSTGILSAVVPKNNRLYMSASLRYKPPPILERLKTRLFDGRLR